MRGAFRNYKKECGAPFLVYLRGCVKKEIQHAKEKGEVKKFRACSRDDYNKAVELVKNAEGYGKNPCNAKVQECLAELSGLSVEKVKELVPGYYRSQTVEEYRKDPESGEENSVFDHIPSKDDMPPEEKLIRREELSEKLRAVEETFASCQKRQREWLRPFITLKILLALEKEKFSPEEIVECLAKRNFLDKEMLKNFLNSQDENALPSQKELAQKIGKDEGQVSRAVSDFFEKVTGKYQLD